MINLVKLNWMELWFATVPPDKLNLSDNISLQCELEDLLELLSDT